MELTNYLEKKCIEVNSEIKDKDGILKEIASLAKKSDVLKNIDEEEVYERLKAREDMTSTGMGKGLAIPHCSFEGISNFIVGIVTSKDGIDFKSVDGKKVKFFIFIIGPKSERKTHIRILSRISSIFKTTNKKEELFSAKSKDEIYNILREQEEKSQPETSKKEYNKITITVQKEEILTDTLNILNEFEDSYISVIDGNNIGEYLYTVPLFSSFWENKEESFHKIILATIPEGNANEVIRRLNMLLEEQSDGAGMAFYLENISYFNGKLKF